MSEMDVLRTDRLEAFSDGVIAILITIMVLEFRAPEGNADLSVLYGLRSTFLSYVLSFVYLGIYWNNHHHLLRATRRVSGAVMWANLHLLFWLSVVPFVTAWMGSNHFARIPTGVYGIVLLMAAISFTILQYAIVRADGDGSLVAKAMGSDVKGKASVALYVVGVLAAFFIDQRLAGAIYVIVAVIWLVPDRRIERVVEADA